MIDTSDSADDISIPGLPKSKLRRSKSNTGGSGSNRTMLTVVVSVIATLLIGAVSTWALGLYPSQRRAAEVQTLLQRAEDALQGERYLNEPRGNDVEDITDAVLALDPDNARAHQLRTAAAVRLRNQGVELRNSGHPQEALRVLRRATRLVEDSEIRSLIDTIQNELHPPVPTTPAAATTTPTPTPAQRPATRVRHPGTHTEPNEPEPVTTQATQSTTFHPTFTPGRDPNQPAPPQPQPQQQVQPQPQPNPDPPQMHGGPSQTDNPPAQDPNGGAVAF
jgi:hypothetical protein